MLDWLNADSAARKGLADKGVTFGFGYTGEVLSNVAGGVRKRTIYEGETQGHIGLDFGKFSRFEGLTANISGFYVDGKGYSDCCLDTLFTVSNFEALPHVRLQEVWLQQSFLKDTFSVRVGQLGADTEFAISTYATNLMSSTFGWNGQWAIIQPGGGPAYPLSTPGVHLQWAPDQNYSLQLGIFNGDPARPPKRGKSNNPEIENRHGLNFRLADSPFLMLEQDYSYMLDGKSLPGTLKVGGWYNFMKFNDQRWDRNGLSLANPASDGIARQHSGDGGIYATLDQMVWQRPDNSKTGLAVFSRIMVSPSKQNLISFYMDGGINVLGPLPGRDNDVFAVGFAVAKISSRARGLDRDQRAVNENSNGAYSPIRTRETLLEVSYTAQINKYLSLQPDLQYIWRPSGGVVDPRRTNHRVKNVLVLGLRATSSF